IMEEVKFERITACGECCDGCAKYRAGACPGCIDADGQVPEWKESGGCPIHRCARRHGVQFCGLCEEFPCTWLKEKIVWNPHAVDHLAALAEAWRQKQ
ncbi:MAG: DUF3795 domain-containing protein, partial [Clostridiales bacterium]|nr:DUF3795 domain-containing protein [Clostridiales bacterium]